MRPCLLFLLLFAGLDVAAAAPDFQAKRREWAERLAEPEPARRRGALREIPIWDPRLESTYDLVFQGLSDPDPETRIEAGEILVRTRRDPRALADLLDLAGPATPDKNTRMMALNAIARVPDAAFDALDTLRSYTADPNVGHTARRTLEAVEVRRKWIATQNSDRGSPATETPSPAPPPAAARTKPRSGGALWLGLFAIGYGALTIYLRAHHPERLGKLEALKERWGDDAGTAVHWTAYTVLPILVGLVLMAVGLR